MDKDLIRVAILAPILAVRVGLRTLLSDDGTIDVIAEAGGILEMEDDLAGVDIVVFHGANPFEDWQPPAEIEVQVAYVWVTDDPQSAGSLRGIPSRAWGIVPLDSTEDELVAAVFAVDQGYIVAPEHMLEPLWIEQIPADIHTLAESLAPREVEVLQTLALGFTNKQIALELDISEHTVKFHISSIYGKLGATSRTEAIRLGLQLGIIVL